MKDFKSEEYKISRMTIEKGIVSWEGNAIRIPGIVRIWIGGVPKKMCSIYMVLIPLLIALSSSNGLNLAVMLAILAAYVLACVISQKLAVKAGGANRVNLELYNGKIYSFAAGNEAFAHQLYGTFQNLLEAGGSDLHYEIFFEDGGKIIDQFETGKEEATGDGNGIEEAARVTEDGPEVKLESLSDTESEPDSQIMRELKKLHQRCIEKTDSNNEILALIGEARALTARNDREGLKAVFGRFVTSGLINDCNELGLDTLLQEIKSAVF